LNSGRTGCAKEGNEFEEKRGKVCPAKHAKEVKGSFGEGRLVGRKGHRLGVKTVRRGHQLKRWDWGELRNGKRDRKKVSQTEKRKRKNSKSSR